MDSKIKVSRRDIIWNYFGMFLSMGINYLILPFTLYFLDGDVLGLWYVFQNIGTLSSLFDCGFSISFARNINYCWNGATILEKEERIGDSKSEVDFYLLKTIILSSKIIYMFISVIALLLIGIFGTIYINYLDVDLPENYLYACWCLYLLSLFLSLYYSYFIAFLRGIGEIAKLNKIIILSKLSQLLITLILFIFDFGILSLCIGYFFSSIFLRLLAKNSFYKIQALKIGLNRVDDKISKSDAIKFIKIIWHNAWRDGIVAASDYFLNQFTVFLCSIYFTLTETGIYALTIQLIDVVFRIACVLHTNYLPVLQSAFVLNDLDKAKKAESLSIFNFITFFSLGISFLIALVIPLMDWFKPNTVLEMPLVWCASIYYLVLGVRNISTYYFSTTNRVPYVKAFLLSSAANAIMAIIGLHFFHMGILGMLLVQLLSQLFYNAWKWPMLALKELKLGVLEMIRLGFTESVKLIKK